MIKKVAPNSQLGQTLIETLVAIFILITALITATSVAYYSFKNIDNSSQQVIGTALAREGLEAVKNIRDSNWQHGTLSACDTQIASGQKCYPNWLNTAGQPNLSQCQAPSCDYLLDFDPSTNQWTLSPWPNSFNFNPAYSINYNNGNYRGGWGLFSGGQSTNFFRKIDLTFNTAAPYTANSPQVIVTSTVWWTSRSCPSLGTSGSLSALPASCQVVLQTHLTNWKNY